MSHDDATMPPRGSRPRNQPSQGPLSKGETLKTRRWALVTIGAVGTMVAFAATAWACVSGPAVNLSTVNAQPGQEVTVSGTNFRQPNPVTVRWNALDGPVLATFDEPSNRLIGGTFTVPADARAGNYVVIFSQTDEQGSLTQLPIRALLTVTPDGSAAPVLGGGLVAADVDRPAGLVIEDNSVSGATLALVGLGVAGIGMFVAGMAALFAGRGSKAPVAVPARR
jgi:hypothetical protein